MKKKKHFSMLRLILVMALKDVSRAERARQYILGDTAVAKEHEEFEAWRYSKYCSERGIRTSDGYGRSRTAVNTKMRLPSKESRQELTDTISQPEPTSSENNSLKSNDRPQR